MTEARKDYWRQWAIAALIRAVRTFAQAAIAALPATAYLLSDVNWILVLSMAAGAAILSLLTSLATGLPEVPMPKEAENGDD